MNGDETWFGRGLAKVQNGESLDMGMVGRGRVDDVLMKGRDKEAEGRGRGGEACWTNVQEFCGLLLLVLVGDCLSMRRVQAGYVALWNRLRVELVI